VGDMFDVFMFAEEAEVRRWLQSQEGGGVGL
jgi:hypothetical protein